jgi:hypothetical protein
MMVHIGMDTEGSLPTAVELTATNSKVAMIAAAEQRRFGIAEALETSLMPCDFRSEGEGHSQHRDLGVLEKGLSCSSEDGSRANLLCQRMYYHWLQLHVNTRRTRGAFPAARQLLWKQGSSRIRCLFSSFLLQNLQRKIYQSLRPAGSVWFAPGDFDPRAAIRSFWKFSRDPDPQVPLSMYLRDCAIYSQRVKVCKLSSVRCSSLVS